MLLITYFSVIYGLVTFYAFYAFFKPVIFDHKRYLIFTGVILCWIGALILYRLYIMGKLYYPPLIIRDILISSLFIISGTAFRFISDWFLDQKRKETLQKQNLQTQLDLLKARINPHFLFNTINNIDVLIQKDSAVASEYLYKLSDTLRYVLYETRNNEIPLKKEVEQMEKFIDLQRIRTSNEEYVNFTFTGVIGDQKVAPMIFMTFIENAVKFTPNKKIKHAIDIALDVHGSVLQFHCRNYHSGNGQIEINGNGLGLDLIRQRLDLLYSGRYELHTKKHGEWYHVDLNIDLNDH